MKGLMFLSIIVLCLGLVLPLLAVQVSEDDNYVIIETAGYKAYWNKPAQMGYMQAFVAGSQDSIIGTDGRALYHSGEYSGAWHDWGALADWEVVEESGGRAIVKYTSNDGAQKGYTCLVTYYDSVPYIKHEITVTNTGGAPIPAFQNGHAPMFEVNVDLEGMNGYGDPFPYAAYWTAGGYFGAIYGPDAERAESMAWGDRDPGRMHLVHDNLGAEIAEGESVTIIYYVAFGEGGENEATALAEHVQEEPTTVSPAGSLATTWGQIRAGR